MDNPEKLATFVRQDEDKQSENTTQYMWTQLNASKHKKRK
jgi:hypothetical protein